MQRASEAERPTHRGQSAAEPGSPSGRHGVDGEQFAERVNSATVAGMFLQVPIAVVLPTTVDDAVQVVAICREHETSLLSRGGGTSLAGQCCNTAVVIDWTKYCHRLVSVDPEGRSAVVEPGIVLDDLNAQLAGHGLMVGPRPSTHASCTIGGMIGNNSCGATAQAYGKMVDSVLRLEVLTYDGQRMWVGPTGEREYQTILAEGGRKAEIYRGLRDLRDRHLGEIRTRFPDIPRRVSGYNLDALLPESDFDLARALVGSESTLVTVLHAEIALVPRPPADNLLVLGYPDDGHRFSQAAGRCVGVGNCRSSAGGVMCPSYRATREEEHSTRGRARLLFEMVDGDVITDGWRSEAVHAALDLCLACKGCRSDCPVNVDMATYKAEFLSHHYAGRVRPRQHYSMGSLPVSARIAAVAPRAVNALTHSPGLSRLIETAGGIDHRRSIPRFARRRFTDDFAVRPRRVGSRGRVLLWPDTFTNNFDPHIALAAVEVLEAAGFDVDVPRRAVCCGLTWISTGQLPTAKRVLRRTLDTLRPRLRDGTPVVVLEPSCAAVFRADLPELLHGDEDAHRLAGQTYTLAELLTRQASDWQPPAIRQAAIAQPHCHHHAILGFDTDRSLLARAEVDLEVLDAGCCGLAGNFGFERGHYEVSMACAEDQLMPALRAARDRDTLLADGFSCRTQITHAGGGGTPVHSAELLAAALRR